MRGLQKHPRSHEGRVKMFKQKTRNTRQNRLPKLERNAVIYIQSATCFWQEKGACPTCTFDLETEQKERVQPAPCVGKKAKVTCQLAPWFWQLPFGSSVTLSAPLPVAIWLLGFLGYSLTPLPVVIIWFSVGPRSKVPK